MKKLLSIAAVFLAASSAAHAQSAISAASASSPQADASAENLQPLTQAEVRKVDKEAAKLTLRHGPIVNLDMPAMTMVFRVSDPLFLETVKTGDKLQVRIEKIGGQFTVTRLELVK